jgi:eukaryotic-like serine/threonine-protein kinase
MPVADGTAPTQPAGGGVPPPVLAPVGEPEPERERRWPWYAIGVLALALVAALAYVILSGVLAADTKQVPRVTGKQLVEARAVMERAGFEVQTERVQSAQPFDQVLDQDPNGGEEADAGSTVTLEVSGGPGDVLVPAVEHLSEVQAARELRRADLKVTIDPEFSDKVKKGFAIRTVPREGTEVTKGTRVRLLISQGPEQVAVPDVTGQSRDAAEARLRDAGFEPAVEEAESEDVAEDDVISQDPAGGTKVTRGSTVTITVSTGKPQATVPDVIGMKEARAAATLSKAGLTSVREEREVTDPAQDGVVVDQRPGSGAQADEGSEVVIVVGVLKKDDTLAPAPTTP